MEKTEKRPRREETGLNEKLKEEKKPGETRKRQDVDNRREAKKT